MIDQKKKSAIDAVHRALHARSNLGLRLDDVHTVFDSAERVGIEVRFDQLGKIEGFYRPLPDPIIVINSERPLGRQAFTCAHEMGHHFYGDGETLDMLAAEPYSGNLREYRADVFAGIFLMPKVLIQGAFKLRNWDISSITSQQLFLLSCYIGVGYATVAHHLALALGLISRIHMTNLLRVQPKVIKESILGFAFANELVVIDEFWRSRPVDLQIGDVALIPSGASWSGDCVRQIQSMANGICLEATKPGLGQASHSRSSLSAFIRVSRRNFVGRNKYRHFEEFDDEST